LKLEQQEKVLMSECPVCENGRFLNRLAKDRFFCTNCLEEYYVSRNKTYIVEIDPKKGEGKLMLCEN
jgi:uncharacterized protein (DUF983 family)